MKKIKLIMLLTLIIFITSGCVKYDLQMEAHSDKSFKLKIVNAMLSDYYSLGGYDDYSEYEDLGYEVSEYSDSSYKGIVLTKEYENIDDISSSDCSTVELTELLEKNVTEVTLFKSEKEGPITTYTANFTYDLSTYTTDDDTTTGDIDYSEYSDSMIFQYTISLSDNYKIISSNADSFSNDGYTLTWKIEYGELKKINFVFSIDNNTLKEYTSDLDENITSTEKAITDNTETLEVTTVKNINPISYIVVFVMITVIIGGVALFKSKLGNCKKRKFKNNYSAIYHDVSPNDYINKNN